MTEKEKQLLLKDICARLPYTLKVNVHVIGSSYNEDLDLKPEIAVSLLGDDDICIKPYLRPMSSMTKEEMCDLVKLLHAVDEPSCAPELISLFVNSIDGYDWLNKHHFDYRGLIPMGLAIEAKEGMYK